MHILCNKYIPQPHEKNIIQIVNLKKIFSTTQLHKFTVYTKDGEDLHKEPPP